jgi:hypothetical protein
MENNKLQSIIDNLIPYLRTIIIDEDNDYKPMVLIVAFKQWELPNNNSFNIEITEINSKLNELTISINDPNLNLDDLISFIYWDIINYNDILEKTIERIEREKEEELQKVKESLIQGNNYKPIPNKVEELKEITKNKPKQKIIKEKPIENIIDNNYPNIEKSLLERDTE